jgi:hypothetical protein
VSSLEFGLFTEPHHISQLDDILIDFDRLGMVLARPTRVSVSMHSAFDSPSHPNFSRYVAEKAGFLF